MPRDLFGDVSDPSVRVGSRKWYTVPLSLAAHTVVLLLVIVIPLVATGALPDPHSIIEWVPAVTGPLPVPPPVRPVPPANRKVSDPSVAPIEPPHTIAPDLQDRFEDGVEGAPELPGGGTIDGSGVVAPPPPPPPAKTPTEPVRPGGNIRAPERIQYVAPVYPPIAQTVRKQGVVIIEAVIGVDGRVQNARILRSEPLLDEAALVAVRQWTYTPTLLNGVPVPVIMTVTVSFQLQP
jgi:periplasmic protein TonB